MLAGLRFLKLDDFAGFAVYDNVMANLQRTDINWFAQCSSPVGC